MATFATQFGIKRHQADLDFVNVQLNGDTPLYVCPFAISQLGNTESDAATACIRSFFTELINSLRGKDKSKCLRLLSNLHEPNETFLGVSAGRPRGRGVGTLKAGDLMDALLSSRAVKTGQLRDLSETALFIPGFGRDTVSDLATNVLRDHLATYTEAQCALHGVPTRTIRSLGPHWDPMTRRWVKGTYRLPLYERRPVVLVPKDYVRFSLSLESKDFYNHEMVEFYQAEHLSAGSALVETLKDGRKRVTKKSVKEVHGGSKDEIAHFANEYPSILEAYKERRSSTKPLRTFELKPGFSEADHASELATELARIPAGKASATQYHSLVAAILTFLFHPDLVHPVMEQEIHEGRKRIDIRFSNSANSGFFLRVLSGSVTRAISVPVECKNYASDPSNPELDQLSCRFSLHRGKFGILTCRTLADERLWIKRLVDTYRDDRGAIVTLTDADLIKLLSLRGDSKFREIERFMNSRFDQLLK